MSNVIPCRPGMAFEQRESHRYAFRWYVGKRRCSSFPTQRIENKSTTEQISATGNVAERPRSGRPRKTTPQEDRFLTTSSRRNRFFSSRKLGRLLRNATDTRVCDRTVRTRLHAARLKAYRPYVGIFADVTELSSLLLYRI